MIATTTRAASATSSAVTSRLVHALVPALEEEERTRTFAHVEVEHPPDDDLVVAAGVLGFEATVEVGDGLLKHGRARHPDAPRGLLEAIRTLLGEEVRELFVILTEDVDRERAGGLDPRPRRRGVRDAEEDQ